MKITVFTIILILAIIGLYNFATAQTQKGMDINGDEAGDLSGFSVSMPDANTIAIGAPSNDDNGGSAGQVRVFEWNGSTWEQKGIDIDGESGNDRSGWSVSMPDANNIAIGATLNDDNGLYAGHVRVFSWDSGEWKQKGKDIDGKGVGDQLGYSVSMTDANTFSVGAPGNDDNGIDAGQVQVYEWIDSIWAKKGADIVGDSAEARLGYSISMPDANTLAIGSPGTDKNGSDAGQVMIYEWKNSAWKQKGTDIMGEFAVDRFGWSVSMPDTYTIAIGAPLNDKNGIDAGHVRVYQWDGGEWKQKGMDINGEGVGDQFGYSVGMPDANTLAIGSPGTDKNGSDAGQVRVYKWNESSWMQKGVDINGVSAGDRTGSSISMPNANTLSIGGYLNDSDGAAAGHVQVFNYSLSGISE